MPSCYYYDEQRNRCNCYINENLNELLAENAKLRSLCEMLLETYRLGAVTCEDADKFWCREMYDRGMRMLRELGVDV